MAKSTLYIEFTQVPSIGTSIVANVNGAGTNHILVMVAVAQRTGSTQFTVIDPPPTSSQPAFSFVTAWNIDHKDVGGFDNIKASFETINSNPGVKIEINNEYWTFNSVQANNVTSGELVVNFTNADPPPDKSWQETFTGADCDDANYDIAITGGTAPYTITGLPSGTLTGIGANISISIPRGIARTIRITDDAGELIDQKQIVPPRVLDTSHFTVTVIQESGAKATIEPNVVLDTKILPVEYSVDGTNYQGSGIFTGLDFDQQYTAYIRDTFGCVKTKTFITPSDLTGGEGQALEYNRYFEKSNTGSLIFAKLEGTPTNYTNSLSFEELVKLPYETEVLQYKDWLVVDQFKSGYSYHKITLIEDGQAKYIEPVLQAQNLNVQEKVDCFLFGTSDGGLGIYFRNGNSYEPNTATVIGSSDYDETELPSWAKSGNNITVEGLGLLAIKRVTTDPDRGLYVQLAASYTGTDDFAGTVQALYNIQPYNLYEYAFPMSDVSNCARVIIEMGFVINGSPQIEIAYGSEGIRKINDKGGYLEHTWRDDENKGGIVYQTGILNRLLHPYIKWVGNTESESDTYRGDDETVTLKETTIDIQTLSMRVIGFKMQQKFQRATGMEYYSINGINYRKREMTSTPLKSSNIYRVDVVFEHGGNDLQIQSQEIVLNPPETPLTAKPSIPATIPNYLAVSDGVLMSNGDGGFIIVET